MPSALTISGQAALARVSRDLGTYSRLVAKFITDAPGTDISSCNITAGFLGQTISPNPLTVFQIKPGGSQSKPLGEIKRLLTQSRMIYVNMTPDHHFILFSIDTDKMVILQGFQGVYNFNDWWTKRAQGIINTTEFLGYMDDLFSGHEAKTQLAARALFSFRLSGVIDPVMEIEIFNYLKGKKVEILVLASKAI